MTRATPGFCAICTSERGPFVQRPLGKNDALVSVCASCDDEPAVEARGPERGRVWPAPHGARTDAHGTRSKYNNGKCRCFKCRRANAAYQQQRLASKAGAAADRIRDDMQHDLEHAIGARRS